MPQDFDPKPGDPVELFEQGYVVQPHPQMPSMAYRQKAGRARVYQLRNEQEGQCFALKEFKKRYRTPNLITSAQNLKAVEYFEGLDAAKRRIVLPSDPAAQRYPNLEYAMLMPWIHGTTWFDVLGQAREGDYPHLATAICLYDRFLETLERLEEAGMAHTDISPGNVMVGFDPIDVQLVDLEDMYIPGVEAPSQQNSGSSGYRQRGGQTTWRAEGDRYAAAVLAAEMLILANPEFARKATDEGFFTGHCQTPQGVARFREARPWLEEVAPEFAEVFERSWYADSLEGCPRISELREPVEKLATRPLAPESPKRRVETPISKEPSTESEVAAGTTETPVAANRAPKRLPKLLIAAGLIVALPVVAVGVNVWNSIYASTTPVAATSESTAPADTPVGGEPSPEATAEEYTLTSTLSGHSNAVMTVAFSPDGSLLASGSGPNDQTVKLWDPQSGEETRTLSGHPDSGDFDAIGPDGNLNRYPGSVNSVAFSPDGGLLASGGADQTVKLWDPQSGEELRTLSGHSGGVVSVAFNPDGSLLANGSGDDTVKLWDPRSGDLLRTLTGHSDLVFSVAFSPDGRLLASGSWDDTVGLWNPQTGEMLRSLTGHPEDINSVAFSPDGRLLATGSTDRMVRIRERAEGER